MSKEKKRDSSNTYGRNSNPMSVKISQLTTDLRTFFHPEFGASLKDRVALGVAPQESPKPNYLVF
ncbi:MAG: hypothetical protein K2X47_14775, partial [Bdellovibrionales bacterium]|nr:hypothetical protein [Bdellovibrionales bacterium]